MGSRSEADKCPIPNLLDAGIYSHVCFVFCSLILSRRYEIAHFKLKFARATSVK